MSMLPGSYHLGYSNHRHANDAWPPHDGHPRHKQPERSPTPKDVYSKMSLLDSMNAFIADPDSVDP